MITVCRQRQFAMNASRATAVAGKAPAVPRQTAVVGAVREWLWPWWKMAVELV